MKSVTWRFKVIWKKLCFQSIFFQSHQNEARAALVEVHLYYFFFILTLFGLGGGVNLPSSLDFFYKYLLFLTSYWLVILLLFIFFYKQNDKKNISYWKWKWEQVLFDLLFKSTQFKFLLLFSLTRNSIFSIYLKQFSRIDDVIKTATCKTQYHF